jgi:hypothetical protein
MVSPRACGLPLLPASFFLAAALLIVACGGEAPAQQPRRSSTLCDVHALMGSMATPDELCSLPDRCDIAKAGYTCSGHATFEAEGSRRLCTTFASLDACASICAPPLCRFSGGQLACDPGCSDKPPHSCVELDETQAAAYDAECLPR